MKLFGLFWDVSELNKLSTEFQISVPGISKGGHKMAAVLFFLMDIRWLHAAAVWGLMAIAVISLSGCYNGANFDMLIKENMRIGASKTKAVEAFTSEGFVCKKSHLRGQENIIWCHREVKFFMPPGRCVETIAFEHSNNENTIVRIENYFRDCPVMAP